jgi:hypothetical protein
VSGAYAAESAHSSPYRPARKSSHRCLNTFADVLDHQVSKVFELVPGCLWLSGSGSGLAASGWRPARGANFKPILPGCWDGKRSEAPPLCLAAYWHIMAPGVLVA